MIKSREQIGQLLLKSGAICEDDLATALKLQRRNRGRLGEIFVDIGVLAPKDLLDVLAERLNVKACILRHGLIDPAVVGVIDREEAKRRKVLPLFTVGNRLTVAMFEAQRLPQSQRLAARSWIESNTVLGLESTLN